MALVSTMTLTATQDLIEKSFIRSMYGGGEDVRKIFLKSTHDWSANHKRIQEIDRDRFAAQKVEGQAGIQRGVSQGYFKDIYRKTISVDRIISGEGYMALEAHKLSDYAMQVGTDIQDKILLDMRNFLALGVLGTSFVDKDGFTIDCSTADGLALFSTAHTLKNVSTTYSNILTGAPSLSNTALEVAEDFFSYNVLDNNGQRIDAIKPNTLITSKKATMRNRVARLFGSTSPESLGGTANQNAGVLNTYKNRYTHLEIEFDVDVFNITDTTKSYWWYLMSIGGTEENSLQAYYVSWLSPMIAPAEHNQSKWYLSFTARAAYGLGAVSGKGAVVSKSLL